jgi:hypothetical protein
MSDRQFVDLYVKIARATEAHLQQPDSIPLVHAELFKASGFSRQEFEAFEQKYRDQPEKWLAIWKAIEQKAAPPPPQ